MPHNALITTLAAGLGVALLMGLVAARLKLPALVGYLVAGIIIGPATPGFVADIELSRQLAEIGVILLMFGVGLHFSVDDLLEVRRIALPGALAQIVVATALSTAVAGLWGWNLGAAIVFGLALSVASTVVLLRALETHGGVESVNGRIAVGWLVVEDLAMVLTLVLLPPLAGGLSDDSAAMPIDHTSLLGTLVFTVAEVAIFVVLMLVVGRRVFPWLLWQVARTGSRELFTLCVIAAAVGIAYGSAVLFGVSLALGAFFGGVVMRESHLSYRAAQESLPLREAFSVLFFVSVGMLFDPAVVVRQPWHVLAVVAIIVVGKSLAAFCIVLAFRYPVNTALMVSASLAQIGEFSFILAGLGVGLGLLPPEGQSLILAGALISIALNPFIFQTIGPAEAWIQRFLPVLRHARDRLADLPVSVGEGELSGHVVLVGYGRVGRRIADGLKECGAPFVVVDHDRELVQMLRTREANAVAGDASDPAVLLHARIARANVLVIATPDSFQARRIIDAAREVNPHLEILLRTHSDEEARLLRGENVGAVFMGEHELAASMTRHVLKHVVCVPHDRPAEAQAED